MEAAMSYRDKVVREIAQIDEDLRNTPLIVLVVISCLALTIALLATTAFGGLHL
jgi:hypothetical protein